MKATLEVELRPFTVPNFVIAEPGIGMKQDGLEGTRSYPLSDIDPITLDKLCRQFRTEIFKKAGKEQPPQASPD